MKFRIDAWHEAEMMFSASSKSQEALIAVYAALYERMNHVNWYWYEKVKDEWLMRKERFQS